MRQHLVIFALLCAFSSFIFFLFAPREHASFVVPKSQWRVSEDSPELWYWTLPPWAGELAHTRTPRRNSSFLFVDQRLIPLSFPYDTVSAADREITGWHHVQDGQLVFRLPKDHRHNKTQGGDRATAVVGGDLRLELNGAMSKGRQLGWTALLLSLVCLAASGGRRIGGLFGIWPLLAIAASVPLVLIASFYLSAFEQLPVHWRSSALGTAFDRFDAIAPGLLLIHAMLGWLRDKRAAGDRAENVAAAASPQQELSWFVRYGWLAGVALIMLSFMRLSSWGVGLTHAWSPVGTSSPFCSAVAYSDAEGYIEGAYHLLAWGKLDEWNQRRPINAAAFATRLVLGGWSIDIAKWIQAVVVAFSAAWAARELARCYGWRAGTAALALFWGCGRLFLITTLSEPLGFALGALALVGLLQQLRSGSVGSGALAIALMTLAQAARPGALFVLPALVVSFALWGRAWRQRIFLFALGGTVLVAAMMVNPLLSRLYGTGDNLTGSNFAYTFAGLASGQSWAEVTEAYQDQLRELPNEKAAATFLYKEGLRLILIQPHVFAGELLRGLWQFALDLPRLLVGITLRGDADSLPLLGLQVLLMVALGTSALVRQWYCTNARDTSLWLAVGAGCIASVPLVFLDGGLRVLMATWPPALAWLATALTGPAMPMAPAATWHFGRGPRMLAGALAAVLVITIPMPWVLHHLGGDFPPPSANAAEEPQNGEPMEGMPHRETAADVQILRVDQRMRGPGLWVRPGGMSADDWQRELQMSGIGFDGCLLSLMPAPPFHFNQVFDFETGTLKILFFPGDLAEVRADRIVVEICGGSNKFGRRISDADVTSSQDSFDAQGNFK